MGGRCFEQGLGAVLLRGVVCKGGREPACWYHGSMKTTLELPDDLVRAVKIRAVEENKKLSRLAMRIPGQRIKRTRLIQAEKYVVAVEVEMVIPIDDPSEPCYESETVELLREVKEHAERGDLAWLREKGKVYAAVEAA